MSNVEHLRHLLRFTDGNESEHESLLAEIEFARAELGIADREIPPTPVELKRLRDELVGKLKPPTPGQLRELDRLLLETGGTLNGTLFSGAATQLLIDYLRDVKLPELENEAYRRIIEELEANDDVPVNTEFDANERGETDRVFAIAIVLMLFGFLLGIAAPAVGIWVGGLGLILTVLGVGFGILAGWDWDIRYLFFIGALALGSCSGSVGSGQ